MTLMDELDAAEITAAEFTPGIVLRHREVGILTWALIHQIEDEIINEVIATGKHSPSVITMIRSADVMRYPKDDRPASFEGHSIMPPVFVLIEDAWKHVH